MLKKRGTAKILLLALIVTVITVVSSCGKSAADSGASTNTSFLPNPAL